MRIDDLNRALQAHQTDNADAARPEHKKGGGISSSNADPDAASISSVAAHALESASDASSIKSREARLEMLRLQVERGEYKVSADDVAASIIDQHRVG